MKLAVNMVVHTLNVAIAESLKIATLSGISLENAYDILDASVITSPFLKYKRPAFMQSDTPVAMRIDTVLKDMNLIQDLGNQLGITLFATPAIKDAYSEAVAQGLSDRDMARLIDAV